MTSIEPFGHTKKLLRMTCLLHDSELTRHLGVIVGGSIFWLSVIVMFVVAAFLFIIFDENISKADGIFGIVESLILIAGGGLILVKYIDFLRKKKLIKSLIDEVETLLEEVNADGEHTERFRRMERDSKTIVLYYTGILLPISCIVYPFSLYQYYSGHARVMLYAEWVPFMKTHVPLAVCEQAFLVLMTLTVAVCVSSLLATFTVIVSSLSEVLQHLFEETNDSSTLKSACRWHRQIVRIVVNMNDIFSFGLFAEYLMSILEICFSGFVVVKSLTRGDPRFPRFLLMLFTSLSYPFVYLICGTAIANENDKIMRAIYNSKWYEMSVQDRKDILFAITMSSRRFGLHFRRVLYLDMTNFTAILRGSYSLVAVLQMIE